MSWRRIRLLIAAGLLLAAGATYVPHLTQRISSSAVVNAEVLKVSAPVPGVVAPELPPAGRRLSAGAELPLVVRLLPEERERFRLQTELAAEEARIRRAEEALVALERHREEVLARQERLQQALHAVLAAEAREAEAEMETAVRRVRQMEDEEAYARFMVERGLWARQRLEAASVALAVAQAQLETLRSKRERIEVERAAVAEGGRMRHGHDDVPYMTQHLDRLTLLRETLLDRLAEARARREVLAAAVQTEEELVRRRMRFAAPVEHDVLVWRRHLAPGVPVQAGEPLVDLVRCDRLFVEVALPDRAFRDIVPGAKASVLFPGGFEIEGTVSAFRGGGARREDALAAADLPKPPGHNMLLRVSLPEDAAERLGGDHGTFCGIGRFAEVKIPGRTMLRLQGWLDEMAALSGRIVRALIQDGARAVAAAAP